MVNLMINQFMEIRLIDDSDGRDLRAARIEFRDVEHGFVFIWSCEQMNIRPATWIQGFREAYAISDKLDDIKEILLSIPVEDRGVTYAGREDQ
jgi:hypothetical protein